MTIRRSTIVFTEVTSPILGKLKGEGFDLRSVINGALIAFNKLNGDEQKRAIAEANGLDAKQEKVTGEAPQTAPVDKKKVLTDAIKNITKLNIDKTTRIKIIDGEEQDLINKLRGLLGPDEPHKQSKKIV